MGVVRGRRILGTQGPASLVWGVDHLLERRSFPRVTVPNMVILGQKVRAYVLRTAGKYGMDTSRPAFQGHWNRHGSIGYL